MFVWDTKMKNALEIFYLNFFTVSILFLSQILSKLTDPNYLDEAVAIIINITPQLYN